MRTLPARQPPGQQFRLPSAPTTPRAAHSPPRVTSKARVVVSGPNLSDFDRPSAQGGQDETLAQEVAARVAEGVRLGRHVRALRKGAGHRDTATSNGRKGRDPSSGGDSGGGPPKFPPSAPQPPARPRGLEQEDGETRHRVRGERGGAGGHLPASAPSLGRPPRVATPLLARTGTGRCPAALPLGRVGAGRCLGHAAIGPLLSWVVRGPRQQRATGGSALWGTLRAKALQPVSSSIFVGSLPAWGQGEATSWFWVLLLIRYLTSLLKATPEIWMVLSPPPFSC